MWMPVVVVELPTLAPAGAVLLLDRPVIAANARVRGARTTCEGAVTRRITVAAFVTPPLLAAIVAPAAGRAVAVMDEAAAQDIETH
jgi:hypothetical protein